MAVSALISSDRRARISAKTTTDCRWQEDKKLADSLRPGEYDALILEIQLSLTPRRKDSPLAPLLSPEAEERQAKQSMTGAPAPAAQLKAAAEAAYVEKDLKEKQDALAEASYNKARAEHERRGKEFGLFLLDLVPGVSPTKGFIIAVADGRLLDAPGHIILFAVDVIPIAKGVKALGKGAGAATALGRLEAGAEVIRAPIGDFLQNAGRYQFRAVGDLTAAEIAQARANTRWARVRLFIGKGQYRYSGTVAEARPLLADLTAATRREAALVQLNDGRIVIRLASRGREAEIVVTDVADIAAHTHPSGLLIPSGNVVTGDLGDLPAWGRRGQIRAYLISPDGNAVLWESPSGHWTTDIRATVIPAPSR